MGFEETELRLGLPGNTKEVVRKRGFSETETETETQTQTVDLVLNLSSKSKEADTTHNKEKTLLPADPAKPPPK